MKLLLSRPLASLSIALSKQDKLIISFAEPFNILVFGVNKAITGEMFTNLDARSVDLTAYPKIVDLPYQISELIPGK